MELIGEPFSLRASALSKETVASALAFSTVWIERKWLSLGLSHITTLETCPKEAQIEASILFSPSRLEERKDEPVFRICFFPTRYHLACFLYLNLENDWYPALWVKRTGWKNNMVKSHASLFGFHFWTFNLGDNRPILEPVFVVEGRSTTVLTLRPKIFKRP